MNLRITTLSENVAGRINLLAEWGLSILVETDTVNILLDTGQSISVGHNAEMLGVDLSRIDKVVLSHSHGDHTGGLREVLNRMRKSEIEIIAHPDVWADKYARRKDGAARFLGVPFQRQELENLGARFHLDSKAVKITDNIMTTGEVPMVTEFEQIDPNLFIKENDSYKPDYLLDDQALVINTEAGLVIVLGCAHRGIINTLYHARQLTGVNDIYMVIGGCHLIGAKIERISSTINALKELGVSKLGVSHCTGLPASAILAHEFGDDFFFNNAGTVIELP